MERGKRDRWEEGRRRTGDARDVGDGCSLKDPGELLEGTVRLVEEVLVEVPRRVREDDATSGLASEDLADVVGESVESRGGAVDLGEGDRQRRKEERRKETGRTWLRRNSMQLLRMSASLLASSRSL